MSSDSTRSVLIVDETLIAIILSEIFEEEGYRVHLATNAGDAIELLSHVEIDLVVLDMNVGGFLDDFPLTLWARKFSPRAKIIVTSDNGPEVMPIVHGFDAIISKTVIPELLLTIAGTLLDDQRWLLPGLRSPASVQNHG